MLCLALAPAAAARPHLAAVDALAARVESLVDEAERCAKIPAPTRGWTRYCMRAQAAAATTTPNTYSAALTALEARRGCCSVPCADRGRGVKPAPSAHADRAAARAPARAGGARRRRNTRERQLRRKLQRRSKRKVRPKR